MDDVVVESLFNRDLVAAGVAILVMLVFLGFAWKLIGVLREIADSFQEKMRDITNDCHERHRVEGERHEREIETLTTTFQETMKHVTQRIGT